MKKLGKICGMLLLTSIVATTALSGCKKSNSTTFGTADSSAKKNVTLSVVMAKGWKKDCMTTLFNKYTKATGVKFNVQVLPDDTASNIIKTKFATNEFPDILLNSASTRELTYMLPQKNLVDLSKQPWVSKLIDKTQFEDGGKVYGLPLAAQDYWGFAINKDVFKKYKIPVPGSKAAFLKAMDTLKANNVLPFYLGSKDAWMLGNMTSSGIWSAMQHDPNLLKKMNTNQVKYSQVKSFIDCLTDIRDWNKKGYFGPNTMADTWDGQFAEFANDKCGVVVGLTSWVSELDAKYPGAGNKIQFIPYYIGDNTTVCASSISEWYVPKTGKNISTVEDFFKFATQKANLNAYFQSLGALSPFKDVTYKLAKASQDLANKMNNGTYKTHQTHNSIVQGQDWDGLCQVVQEDLLGMKTPLQSAQEYDTMRAKIAKSIGLKGF
jgi:ABC-type sugar transport system, periplasmic component